MNGPPLSSATKALLQAAKADAPSQAARAKVWSGVSGAIGGAAGAAGAAAAGAGGSSALAGGSAAKMLAVGTLLGGTITVGLAAMLLHITAAPRPPTSGNTLPVPATVEALAPVETPPLSGLPPTSALAAVPGSLAAASPRVAAAGATAKTTPHAAAARPARPAPVVSPAHDGRIGSLDAHPDRDPSSDRSGAGASAPEDALAREARLVGEARALLAAGNAQAALARVRAARAMPSPQLVPEELTVEAQALRALGQADEASGVSATLRSQFPDSALAK